MSKFITSYINQIMSHKITLEYKANGQTFKVIAKGTLSGNALEDYETDYTEEKVIWNGHNIFPAIKDTDLMGKIYDEMDKQLADKHFEGRFASVVEYENQYQEN